MIYITEIKLYDILGRELIYAGPEIEAESIEEAEVILSELGYVGNVLGELIETVDEIMQKAHNICLN